ncbi:hypothetical protein GCM10025791_15960 [Halioxenophilus aromaticivorans]|uniref:Uncharacterized protein n=1 Tax=Halioxenophilus aromaticivorans TaxID=1306992 RepID=A0AAV3U174_9ALTE
MYDLAQGELAYCPVEEANAWSLAAWRYSDKRSEIDSWLDNHALMLPTLEAYQHHMTKDAAEQEAFSLLAWGHQNYGLLSVVGVTGFNTFDGILSLANRAFIAEVNEAWSQYQAGHINKNQYDYGRKKALEAFARQVGPFEKLLFRGGTTKEAIRITRAC